MHYRDRIISTFREVFHEQPLVVRSPGRVNLIGEHTDYNMGFVLPAAIDKAMYLGLTPRADSVCRFIAIDMDDSFQCTIDALHSSEKGWPNYLMGVVDQLLKAGHAIGGFNCVFGGDIPIGAGLSSSAALEAGLAFGLNTVFALGIDKMTIVKLAQKAENEFVGVNCGIMDQYISVFGAAGSVLRIDCRSLANEYFPFAHDVSIVLFDTCVKHSLASSAYNRRREECTEGVAAIRRGYPHVTHLRDVSSAMLEEFKGTLDSTIYKRCRYVVGEDERLLKACTALEDADLKTFGEYMKQTHAGLSRDYEVSCDELDFLAGAVEENPSVYGARMMGGGFGGCTINLIRPDAVQETWRTIAAEYKKKFGIDPKMYITTISAGTSIITNEL